MTILGPSPARSEPTGGLPTPIQRLHATHGAVAVHGRLGRSMGDHVTAKRSQGSVALRDILGASAVRALIGRKLRDDGRPVSRDTLARFRQSETFPKPMQVPNVSDREPLWRRQDVNAWIDDQPPMRSWERGA